MSKHSDMIADRDIARERLRAAFPKGRPQTTGSYGWLGWEAETDLDNDDDREGVYFLTIVDPDGEEYAVIMHRVCGGKYPLDGEVAQRKVRQAEHIVAALNAAEAEPA